MKSIDNRKINNALLGLVTTGLLLLSSFFAPAVFAQPNYIYFAINGDTTLSTMTQGDELFWGSNCDMGATINWEIWFDANVNSVIDPSTDFLLSSEHMTDGNLLADDSPIPDGWVLTGGLDLSGEPGKYIFRATDIDTDVSVQKIATMVAMSSPPNQLKGQISIPGVTAPNAMLANRFVVAESETGEEGVYLAFTNSMGNYSMNVGVIGSGVEFYLLAGNIDGFAAPDPITAIATGIVANNNFAYIVVADSVWGFVKDETGTVIPFESDVSANSDSSDKEATTKNGRYVIYFSDADKGDWGLESSSVNSPVFVTSEEFYFSHDTLNSFQHDLILTRTDALIYARITENGGLPANNYRVDAYSLTLKRWAESVSGTGANNVVGIGVSSMDNSGWEVSVNQYDWDLPIPTGLIAEAGAYTSNVSPGDTVSFNMINGQLVSGIITLDPGDDPVVWDDLYVFAGSWGARVGDGGVYSLYTDIGSFWIAVYTDTDLGFATHPAWRNLNVTGDTTSGLGFLLNRTHARVSGTLTNIPLPIPGIYNLTARTGTDGSNGYEVYTVVDPNTGTYSMNLCDGNWTITAPDIFGDPSPPDPTLITIGEIPDTARTVDFAYASFGCCGLYTGGFPGNTNCGADGKRNLADIVRLIDRVYLTKTVLCCEENGDVNGDVEAKINLADIVLLIDHVYLTKAEVVACQ